MKRTRRMWFGLGTLALTGLTLVPSAGAADPHAIADARFAAMNGPLAQFVVTPSTFGMDPSKVLTDIPPLLNNVDAVQLKADTTTLANQFRSSASPQSDLDAARDIVTSRFVALGFTPTIEPVTFQGKSMPNISVTVPGTGCATKILQLSAHYDAKGPTNPGADDDASAMAALFEVARILKANPQPVTVRLVAYAFEEDGLIGSFQMAGHDAQAKADIVGAVSMDMIGYTDTSKTDPFVGLPADYLAMVADPSSAKLARAMGAGAYWYTPEFPAAAAIIDPKIMSDIFRSDHAPYVLKGYQGLMATDTANFRNPNYHTPNDTLDTIDWDFQAGSTRAVLAGLTTYASSDQDANGVADLCQGEIVAPSTTTSLPSPKPAADAARPVASEPTYTG